MRPIAARLLAPLLFAAPVVPALAGAEPATPPVVLETIVVSGRQPGPGLWKVTNGEHVLWVLGTLRPLPKRMEWVADEVKATIAQAQEIVLGPSAELEVDEGFLGGLFLLPSLLGARNNPNDAKLADVLPPELYARWQVSKRKYLPRSRSIEKRRPVFAAHRLYDKAIERSGLTLDDVVAPVVKRAARRADVPLTRPTVEVKLDRAADAIREFAKASLDDAECLRRTLDRLETDLESMKERANAWAIGDLETLRALPYADQNVACSGAFLESEVLKRRGFADLEQRLAAAWLAAAEAALAKNRVSFATLPMRELLEPTGYLAALRQRGYTVEEP